MFSVKATFSESIWKASFLPAFSCGSQGQSNNTSSCIQISYRWSIWDILLQLLEQGIESLQKCSTKTRNHKKGLHKTGLRVSFRKSIAFLIFDPKYFMITDNFVSWYNTQAKMWRQKEWYNTFIVFMLSRCILTKIWCLFGDWKFLIK